LEPIKNGRETSEFGLARLVILGGFVLDIVAILLEGLKKAGFEFGWLPVAMATVGTLVSMAVAMGYQRNRSMVKVQALVPKVAEEVNHIRPLFLEAKAIVEELKAERARLPGGLPTPQSPQP
jgi:hypothetical protein